MDKERNKGSMEREKKVCVMAKEREGPSIEGREHTHPQNVLQQKGKREEKESDGHGERAF
jgi:hypothetical protein